MEWDNVLAPTFGSCETCGGPSASLPLRTARRAVGTEGCGYSTKTRQRRTGFLTFFGPGLPKLRAAKPSTKLWRYFGLSTTKVPLFP
jgi:hypothetical protein